MSEDYYSHRHSSTRVAITSVDDSGPYQTVGLTALDSESFTQVMRIQPHGFSSVPPVGAHGHGISPGGSRERLYMFGGEDPASRPTGTPSGQSVLYDDKGNVIFMKGSSGIVMKAKKGGVIVSPQQGQLVYVGGDPADGGTFDWAMTASGPSTVVKIKIS